MAEGGAERTTAAGTISRLPPQAWSYLINPPILLIIWILRDLDLIARAPLWGYALMLGAAAVLGAITDAWALRRRSRLSVQARIAAQTAAVTAAIYMTGWGPVLTIAYAFTAQEAIGRFGARAWRSTLAWCALCIALAQCGIALRLVPSLLPTSMVQGLAALEIVGLTIVLRMVGSVTADKEKAESSLRASEDRFRSLVQHSSDLTIVVGEGSRILYASEASWEMLGVDAAQLLGTDAATLVHPEDLEQLRALVAGWHTTEETSTRLDIRLRHADGTWRDVEAAVSDLRSRPTVAGLIVNIRDVTARKAAERALAHHALHDTLTGLPNRSLLMDRLEQSLMSVERDPGGVPALAFLDLDRFKLVNDQLGHGAGDELLVQVARRLRRALRPTDTVARLGGDEFVVLSEGVADPETAGLLGDRIIRCFDERVTIGGCALPISASVGIAIGERGDDAERLLQRADAAMYRAKTLGRGRAVVFDETTGAETRERVHIEGALRRAIDKGEIGVHYQPIFALNDLSVIAVEALARWHDPQRGLVSPEAFIGVAEDTGLIVELGAQVMREACQQVATWNRERIGTSPLAASINLSGKQLNDPNVNALVRDTLGMSELDPSQLWLEVTETYVLNDHERVVATLDALRNLGATIAVDDFGTGYSSLTYLRRFPVGIVKIDRQFVNGIGRATHDEEIVAAVVRLGHALGLRVVAEGIETLEQLQYLQALGCDAGQGFYLARPAPAHVVAFEAPAPDATTAAR